jgi:hypothetical protein
MTSDSGLAAIRSALLAGDRASDPCKVSSNLEKHTVAPSSLSDLAGLGRLAAFTFARNRQIP